MDSRQQIEADPAIVVEVLNEQCEEFRRQATNLVAIARQLSRENAMLRSQLEDQKDKKASDDDAKLEPRAS